MRCFIAINPPEHVKAQIFHKFETLKSKNFFEGKFVEKGNLHLTLKFLGNLTSEEIEKIKTNLREINFEKFNCRVGNPGYFDEKSIKVLWVGLISEELEKIKETINGKTPEISEDHGEFNPHITAARVNEISDRESLINEIEKMNFKKLDFEVDCFDLIKSELSPSGPKYKIIESFSLK